MKKMFVFSVFFSFLISGCNYQETIRIEKESFLIGTLRDYMGREKYKSMEDRVDRYYHYEKRLCHAIDSIFSSSYSGMHFHEYNHKITGNLEYELYSRQLAAEIEKYFSYKYSGRGVYKGSEEFKDLNLDSLSKTEDFYSEYFDSLFIGRIKPEMFETDLQKLSFITGAYVRFGGCNDSTYFISVPNSVSKVRLLDMFLKDVGCSEVDYKMKKDYIPVSHKVYFKPTDNLKSLFAIYMKLR